MPDGKGLVFHTCGVQYRKTEKRRASSKHASFFSGLDCSLGTHSMGACDCQGPVGGVTSNPIRGAGRIGSINSKGVKLGRGDGAINPCDSGCFMPGAFSIWYPNSGSI